MTSSAHPHQPETDSQMGPNPSLRQSPAQTQQQTGLPSSWVTRTQKCNPHTATQILCSYTNPKALNAPRGKKTQIHSGSEMPP